jgi:hypothetical protein
MNLVIVELVVFGCLVVSVLAIEPKVRGRDDGFLRVIKNYIMTSFGREVKPSVPCHKSLRHAKVPYKYETDSS